MTQEMKGNVLDFSLLRPIIRGNGLRWRPNTDASPAGLAKKEAFLLDVCVRPTEKLGDCDFLAILSLCTVNNGSIPLKVQCCGTYQHRVHVQVEMKTHGQV